MADLELLRSARGHPLRRPEWIGPRPAILAPPPRRPRPAQARAGRRLQRIAAWIAKLARDQGTLT